MTNDQGFAWGCRWALHNLPQIILVFVLAFACVSSIGCYWAQIEMANAVQRAAL